MTTHRLAPGTRWTLQLLFVLSGGAALVYQSVWTHYLGLTLGHAAYAQTLVLMMFMGGMAIGAWAVSRITARLARPILAYAGAEAVIGLCGFAFHTVFIAYSAYSQEHVLPALQSADAARTWQWLSAAALIAPQTILLGATFPLLAVGVLRLPGSQQGQTLGGLYFTNGIGAAIGALVATFVLLPAVGMPGALQAAAVLNVLVAGASAALSLLTREGGAAAAPVTPATSADGPEAPVGRLLPALLAATFLSSAASFAYELGWVRMLNQALGSSLHSFELMLAAFIAGLAFGGLWVRRVGDRIRDLVRYAGFVQVAMGVSAMLSVGLMSQAYYWVPALLHALAPTSGGYNVYTIATAGVAVLIMAPAAFFAGMTLPLFTAALLRRGAGERAVGQVYAANTLGAILGVLVAAHLLMPAVGVSLMLLAAGAVDVLIGLVLLRGMSPGRWTASGVLAAGASAVVMGGVLHWGMPDRLLQSAGVFRYGRTDTSHRELKYYRDGATASISVVKTPNAVVIATNGKPDAGLVSFAEPPTADEITMLMLGAMPLAAHPNPQDVAVIGWGSGLSTHTLLGSPLPRRVDTIEIEPAVRDAAWLFAERNGRAYIDRRSQAHFEDAREFFARGRQQYDVVVSEPSNPWVSGVASLFTQEFYAGVKRSLKPGGVLVQWVHSYELSDRLLAQMIAALLAEFPHSEMYSPNAGDLVIVAPLERLSPLTDGPWQAPGLVPELNRVGLAGLADLQARRLAGPATLRTYVRLQDVKPHSDFYPTVSLEAPRERFRGSRADLLERIATDGMPVLQVLECRRPVAADVAVHYDASHPLVRSRQEALWAGERFTGRGPGQPLGAGLTRLVDALRAQRDSNALRDPAAVVIYAANLAQATLAHMPAADQRVLWDAKNWRRALGELPAALQDLLSLYDSTAREDWPAVEAAAARLLEAKGTPLPDGVQEQALVLSMLSGLAQGQVDAVASREARWGAQVPPGKLTDTRRFLKAWTASGEAVCAAKSVAR